MNARPYPRLTRRLAWTWAEADRAFSAGINRLPPEEFSCRNGCFGCCLGLFALPLPEALAVRAAWRGLPAPDRKVTRARAERAALRSAVLFPGDPASGLLDPDRSEAADTRYFESVAAVACPFLDLPSGACRVYEARPLTCRTYGLAIRKDSRLVAEACPLNLPRGAAERALDTAFDAAELLALDQAVAEAAFADGLPAGAETTLAHVLAGTLRARG